MLESEFMEKDVETIIREHVDTTSLGTFTKLILALDAFDKSEKEAKYFDE